MSEEKCQQQIFYSEVEKAFTSIKARDDLFSCQAENREKFFPRVEFKLNTILNVLG